MAKVYVIQESSMDYTNAEAYGDLVFMSVNRRDDFHNIMDSEHNERLMSHLKSFLLDYKQDEDYFIVSNGSPYVSACTMWMLGRLGIRKLNMLRWDNRDRMYRPLSLQLN